MKSFKKYIIESIKATISHTQEIEKILNRDFGNILKALEIGINSNNIHIGQINTGKGEGLGKGPMNAIMSYADYNQLIITLDPDGAEDSEVYNKLKSVYKKYGFKENNNDISSTAKMYRLPERFKLR